MTGIKINLYSKKIQNWDRKVHQKETHSMSGFIDFLKYKNQLYSSRERNAAVKSP